MSSTLLSVSLIVHLSLLFINFVTFSYSQINTINKACAIGGSSCGTGQACINGLCECDPVHRRFWTGEQYQCRVCPLDYIRTPTRCYKYFKASKNHSEARADCRNNHADLFSWRDNSDENELLKASAAHWNYNSLSVKNQFYSWSGGMIHHGQGSRAEYKITWFDPKAPTIPHPDTNDPLTERYCNEMAIANYHGDPEPTRQTKNGEKENCVTIVFLPQPNSRGHICMADDYCSTRMGYICELTEATLSGLFPTLPTPDRIVDGPSEKPFAVNEPMNNDSKQEELTDVLSPLEEKKDSSLFNIWIYVVVGIVLLVIIIIVAFIIIRNRKNNYPNMNVSPTNSIVTSVMSSTDVHQNA
ncbi:unnamed protein product [Rotaria sp. Silwood1]|nr:unnamed protein product [Rotaria sp. Silwood1]CAF1616303.1 unnamed protein product [Rotaria sp. Silwood1]